MDKHDVMIRSGTANNATTMGNNTTIAYSGDKTNKDGNEDLIPIAYALLNLVTMLVIFFGLVLVKSPKKKTLRG
jgi:hypothetical protein